MAYEIHYGPIAERMNVCHRCDNPSCVNPHHLFLGSQRDNAADMVAKGRQKGPRKLTPEIVTEIRGSSMSWRALARKFGVCKETVRKIKNRTWWKHVA